MSSIFFRDTNSKPIVSYGFDLRYEDRHGRKKLIKIEDRKSGFEIYIKSGRHLKLIDTKPSLEEAKQFAMDYYKPNLG
jgi:hypothetical protein